MGSFIGHLLPGVAFICFSVWWMVAIAVQQAINPRAYRNQASHVWPGGRLSPESWLKLMFCSIGIVGELYNGFENGRFVRVGNLQHTTMYAFFLLSGIMDLLTAKKSFGRRFHMVPQGSAFAAVIIAATVEWLLFRFHLHGRNSLDVLVHTLLGHSIAAAILILIAECAFRQTVLLGYLRSVAVMTQGMWFISVGYILHNPFGELPFKNPDDHMAHMLATCVFAWHILVAIIVCAGIVFVCHRRYGPGSVDGEYTRCSDQERAVLKPFDGEDS